MITTKKPISETVSFMGFCPSEEWNSPELRKEWELLLKVSSNLNHLYQSPQWFEGKNVIIDDFA